MEDSGSSASRCGGAEGGHHRQLCLHHRLGHSHRPGTLTQARGGSVPIFSILIGGGVETKVQYSIWKYDDEDEEWRTTTMKMERKRYWHAASIFAPNSNIHIGYVCQYRLH